jgi:hypothetical protein
VSRAQNECRNPAPDADYIGNYRVEGEDQREGERQLTYQWHQNLLTLLGSVFRWTAREDLARFDCMIGANSPLHDYVPSGREHIRLGLAAADYAK